MSEREGKVATCTSSKSLCYWALVFVILLGLFSLAKLAFPGLRPYSNALFFAAAGIACVVNYRRNCTYHCAITAPLFLVAAVVLAIGVRRGWEMSGVLVWAVVLVVVGFAILLERRYAAIR
jgi:hypothetical protein